jgi:hypothetical protein
LTVRLQQFRENAMDCFASATARDAVETMHDGASLRLGKAKVWQFRSQAEIDRQTGFTIALPSAARDGTAEAPGTTGARFDHGKPTGGHIDPQKLLQPFERHCRTEAK